MARQAGLGRGLTTLIPSAPPAAEDSGVYREVPVRALRPNPNQPRQEFDEEALVALAASVRELGVLQPLLVRPSGEGYELIAGERRLRAAQRVGLATVPVIVREVDDASSLAQAVVENIHRRDLHPLEEAAAYRQLLEDFDLTHEQLARRVGRSRSSISNSLRLLQLPARVQRLVADGALSAGHARTLLGCPDRTYQDELAARAVAEGWSVRALEDAVREHGPQDEVEAPARPKSSHRPAAFLELEHLLGEYLSTGVSVRLSSNKGRIIIDFATLDDLERIYRLIHSDQERPAKPSIST